MHHVPHKAKPPNQAKRRASKEQEAATNEPLPSTEDVETASRRAHGDSYSDIGSREDELVGESSSHVPPVNRRLEEPSEPALDARERLEGNI